MQFSPRHCHDEPKCRNIPAIIMIAGMLHEWSNSGGTFARGGYHSGQRFVNGFETPCPKGFLRARSASQIA
jgi:hypothetical protein